MTAVLPEIPSALPSDLLERRPDIAAAERRAAAANASIGVARAAYFPALTLSASGGSVASSLRTLFDTPGRVWSLGATLAQTLFDGGLRQARTAQAEAAYDVTVAAYKQTVLNGFQQVEDDARDAAPARRRRPHCRTRPCGRRSSPSASHSRSTAAAPTSYLAVVTAQALSLANQRTAVQLRSRQMTTSVALIAAIGGGWSVGIAARLQRRAVARHHSPKALTMPGPASHAARRRILTLGGVAAARAGAAVCGSGAATRKKMLKPPRGRRRRCRVTTVRVQVQDVPIYPQRASAPSPRWPA